MRVFCSIGKLRSSSISAGRLGSDCGRFGYRRLHLLLRREGVLLNWKKLYRLYREYS